MYKELHGFFLAISKNWDSFTQLKVQRFLSRKAGEEVVVKSTFRVNDTAPHTQDHLLAERVAAVNIVNPEDLGVAHLQQTFEAILHLRSARDSLSLR